MLGHTWWPGERAGDETLVGVPVQEHADGDGVHGDGVRQGSAAMPGRGARAGPHGVDEGCEHVASEVVDDASLDRSASECRGGVPLDAEHDLVTAGAPFGVLEIGPADRAQSRPAHDEVVCTCVLGGEDRSGRSSGCGGSCPCSGRDSISVDLVV